MPEGNLLFGAIAGIIGTAIITILLFILRTAGQDLDIPYLLGTRFVNAENTNKVYVTGYTFLLNYLFPIIYS